MKDMIKTAINMLVGAFIAASVAAAFAVTGNPPVNGYQTPDGTWLLGLSSGANMTYQSGITAHAGGGQAACTQLQPGIAFYSVDTVASSGDSVCLPYAVAGTDLQIANNSSTTLNIFSPSANNLLTGAVDTINNVAGSSAYTNGTTQKNIECFSPKNGAWRCGSSS